MLSRPLFVSITLADVLASHTIKVRDNVEGATRGHEPKKVGFVGGYQHRCLSQQERRQNEHGVAIGTFATVG